MAYNYNYGYSNPNYSEEEGKMAWDLRQVFAKDLVGETLKQIAIARKSESYSLWFHLLKRDLATEIYKNLEKEQNEEIEKKIKETTAILTKNVGAYLKQNKNPLQHEIVENALTDLEKLMLSLMQINGMFGTKDWEDDGL